MHSPVVVLSRGAMPLSMYTALSEQNKRQGKRPPWARLNLSEQPRQSQRHHRQRKMRHVSHPSGRPPPRIRMASQAGLKAAPIHIISAPGARARAGRTRYTRRRNPVKSCRRHFVPRPQKRHGRAAQPLPA
eukprot:gene13023-biopygen461